MCLLCICYTYHVSILYWLLCSVINYNVMTKRAASFLPIFYALFSLFVSRRFNFLLYEHKKQYSPHLKLTLYTFTKVVYFVDTSKISSLVFRHLGLCLSVCNRNNLFVHVVSLYVGSCVARRRNSRKMYNVNDYILTICVSKFNKVSSL